MKCKVVLSIKTKEHINKAKTVVKQKLSSISTVHIIKLCYRSVLLLAAVTLYVISRIFGRESVFEVLKNDTILLLVVWVVFVVEMIFRFFPSRFESMGCQKQFKRNYKPINQNKTPLKQAWWRTALVAIVWLGFNSIFAVLYFFKFIDQDILLLLSLAYSVCDMICILFFCPFQTWFMGNKCCGSCRIYNWDYAMMFTPLILVPHIYTYSLLFFAVLLLVRWEVTAIRFPERFCENKNDCLSCKNCKEKLCSHKVQLKSYLKKYRARLKDK